MNLKAFLANEGVTLKDFAERLDVDVRYLSQISKHAKLPSRRLALDIEAATNGAVKIPFSLKTKKSRRLVEKQQQQIKQKQEEDSQPDLVDWYVQKREMPCLEKS